MTDGELHDIIRELLYEKKALALDEQRVEEAKAMAEQTRVKLNALEGKLASLSNDPRYEAPGRFLKVKGRPIMGETDKVVQVVFHLGEARMVARVAELEDPFAAEVHA